MPTLWFYDGFIVQPGRLVDWFTAVARNGAGTLAIKHWLEAITRTPIGKQSTRMIDYPWRHVRSPEGHHSTNGWFLLSMKNSLELGIHKVTDEVGMQNWQDNQIQSVFRCIPYSCHCWMEICAVLVIEFRLASATWDTCLDVSSFETFEINLRICLASLAAIPCCWSPLVHW